MNCNLQTSLAIIWQYLNQPVFSPNSKSVWAFHRFFALYQVQFLERCLAKQVPSEPHHYR